MTNKGYKNNYSNDRPPKAYANKTAVVTLGCRLYGETPCKSLYARMDAALEFIAENGCDIVVCSGGQGSNEAISEAEAMRRYFIQNGVPASKLLKEDRSHSTYDNFKFSKQALDNLFGENCYTVYFATNRYHVYRSGRTARLLGLTAYPLPAENPQKYKLRNYVREFFSIIKNHITLR